MSDLIISLPVDDTPTTDGVIWRFECDMCGCRDHALYTATTAVDEVEFFSCHRCAFRVPFVRSSHELMISMDLLSMAGKGFPLTWMFLPALSDAESADNFEGLT